MTMERRDESRSLTEFLEGQYDGAARRFLRDPRRGSSEDNHVGRRVARA